MFVCEQSKKYLMGILNITPDSFYDGNLYTDINNSMKQVQCMLTHNVDIIDVGGESSRPGAVPISIDEELRRVIPVIKQIKEKWPQKTISLDSYKHEVAKEGLKNGVDIINDIYGLKSEPLAQLIASYKASVVVMHMQGNPINMQKKPNYNNVIDEIKYFFEEKIEFALKTGIKENKIILDPGIGFGKRLEDNISIIKNCNEFKKMGYPVLIGASRKSLLGTMLNNKVEDRKNGSIILHTLALNNGADIIRVHDIKESSEIIKIMSYF